MSPATKGVVAVVAGLLLSLALGSLCIWLLILAQLLRPLSAGGVYGWTIAQISIPFAFACGSFVVGVAAGGPLQDRMGPRWPSTIGGVLVGLGMVLVSVTEFARTGDGAPATIPLIVGLGLMVGGGAGLIFACVVPPAIKWSVPRQHGLMVGVVISGLALGPSWLNGAVWSAIGVRGVSSTLMIHGVTLLAVVAVLSQLLEDPLPGYVPPGSYSGADGVPLAPVPWAGVSTRRMLKSRTFRSLWASCVLLGAGTAFVSVLLLAMPEDQRQAVLLTGLVLSVGGCLGAVAAGFLHDRTSQKGPGFVVAALVAGLAAASTLAAMGEFVSAAFLTAACWSGGVVVAWACTAECFGTKSLGANFGLVFTGWCGGVVLGALIGVSAVAGGLAKVATSPTTLLECAAIVAGLAASVVLASRLRPPVLRAVDDPRRGGHGAGNRARRS